LKASPENRLNFCLITWWKFDQTKEDELKANLMILPEDLKTYAHQIDVVILNSEKLKAVYGPTISSLSFLYEKNISQE